MANNVIRIGVLAALLGAFQEGGQDGVRGVELALAEFDQQIAGVPIHLTVEPTAIMPEIAVGAARKLLNEHNVDVVIGPLSGNEGLAIKEFAKRHPEMTFINGISGAQDLTLRNPAPNFYNFTTNGAQWMTGLADYVYNTLDYTKIVTVGEDYSFPYTQVGAFALKYQRFGGTILERFWVPVGTSDYTKMIAGIPDDAQAILVTLTGADSVHFVEQFARERDPLPLLGGSTTFDLSSLATLDDALLSFLDGAVSSSPIATYNPDPGWQAFVAAYRQRYPEALEFPSLFCWGYYVNTKATLLALDAIGGDLAAGPAPFRQALDRLEFNGPCGPVRLGANRQALGVNFVWDIQHRPDGGLVQVIQNVIEDVDPTLGIPEHEYLAIGPFTRDNPPI